MRQNIITNELLDYTFDELVIQRIYEYDNLNRMVTCTETSNRFNDGIQKFNLTYNSDGELIKIVNTFSGYNSTTLIVISTRELNYDSQKNPEKLFYDSLQPNSTSFITTFVFTISTLDNPLKLSLNSFFPLHYIPTHNVLNSKTTFNNAFGENIRDVSYSYQYDGDYPITGERALTRILDGQTQSNLTFQLFWEYSTG